MASASTADWFKEVQVSRPLGCGIIARSQHWAWIRENHGQDLHTIPRIFNPFTHLSGVPGMHSEWDSLSSGTKVIQSSVSSIDSHLCERVLWWRLVTLMLHLDLVVSALLNHAHKHIHKKFIENRLQCLLPGRARITISFLSLIGLAKGPAH